MTVAAFIDTENLVGGLGRRFVQIDLERSVRAVCDVSGLDRSEIVLLAAYGPWWMEDSRLARVRSTLDPGTSSLVNTELSNGKSLLDTKLVLDAGLHFATAPADTYIIMSGDSDMIPLVQLLRERGRRVVGAARPTSTGQMAERCDQFVFLTPTTTGKRAPSRDTKAAMCGSPAEELRSWVEEIVGDRVEVPARAVAASLGNKVQNLTGSSPAQYYEKTLGVRGFKKVISKLFPNYDLAVTTDGSAVERRVEDGYSEEEPLEESPPFRGVGVTAPRDEEPLDEGGWDSERMVLIDLPTIGD